MVSSVPPSDKETLAIHEHPLGEGLKYLKALVLRYPGTIQFQTGAGHIIHDLFARLPSIPQLENQKTALCNNIVETVYPLAACLLAEDVNMTLTATSEPLEPPDIISGLATYTAFDMEHDIIRHCFVKPPCDKSYIETLTIPAGLGVLCEPVNYDSGRFHGDRKVLHNPSDAICQWTERLLVQWYDQNAGKAYVPVRIRLPTNLLNQAQILGVVDAATIARLESGFNPSPDSLAHPHTPKSVSAFAHEAGFAETARSDAGKPRSAPGQSPGQLPADPRTGNPLPAGITNSNAAIPFDPRTGRILPAGITNLNAAVPLDPQTGKLLPAGVTDPRQVLSPGLTNPNTAANSSEPAPKDAHGHNRHHGPDIKPDVN